jgi:hypothetical protein
LIAAGAGVAGSTTLVIEAVVVGETPEGRLTDG